MITGINRDRLGRFLKGSINQEARERALKFYGSKNPNWKGGRPKCLCGKELWYDKKGQCQDCYLSTIKGSRNPNWRGGKTKLIFSLRTSKHYDQWRSDVFKRDNWTCQTCHKQGCYLEAHHKIGFSKIIHKNNIASLEEAFECKELWDLTNGVSLCRECHGLTKK